MFRAIYFCLLLALLSLAAPDAGQAARVGTSSPNPLMIVSDRQPRAAIVVAADAGKWEAKAAADLHAYVRKMTGAELSILHKPPAQGAAILLGKTALAALPGLRTQLAGVAKKNPVVQADAIAVRRSGDRLYVAGANDESHYFAVAWLLQQWGCRWYMPTDFGEVVPAHSELSIGTLAMAYAPPFEIRHYWLAWNADTTGADEFRHRNFMSDARLVGVEQALDRYTADIAPKGGTHFNVPFSARETAEHVAARIEADYAAGKDVSLAVADGLYSSPADRPLVGEYDPYMLRPSITDAMLTLYNNVAAILRRKYPASRARIGAMAYANATLPPRRIASLAPNIMMWIAPIDIDPNHALDDPRSLPRREYRQMLEQWSKVTRGRLAIYDYDQSMLVWRDLPNPSQHVFARDVKEYRRLGLLGIGTESRGAFATTFLNLFFRGQLMWDPDANVEALLTEFFPGFYGPAAAPMERYWRAILRAWEDTAVTEHEYMAAPAIYTPELVAQLKHDLDAAEAALRDQSRAGANAKRYAERMEFTRLGFEILSAYVAMSMASARDADYAAAAAAGEAALKARKSLAARSPIFTTRVIGVAAEVPENGAAWFPGEVVQMRELAALTDGTRGSLLAKLPIEWEFAVERPLAADWRYAGREGPEAGRGATPPEGAWRPARSDLYLQGQGIVASDGQAALGHYWYRTTIDLQPRNGGSPVHLRFPGLFNEAWLYVNGQYVAHRHYAEPWWLTDYRFEWDVDVSRYLTTGSNRIELRGFNPHHFGGMFRRPFLYLPTDGVIPPSANPSAR